LLVRLSELHVDDAKGCVLPFLEMWVPLSLARWWEMVREAEMPPTTVRPISETMHHGGNSKMGRGGSGLVRQISFVAVIRLK
jgi:hypothetical protein